MPRKPPAQRKAEEERDRLKRELKDKVETVRDFNARLRKEGRWNEYSYRARTLRDESEGTLTLAQAQARLRPQYPPLEGAIQPMLGVGLDSPVCLEWDDDCNEGSFFEVLEWVSRALGQTDAGAQLKAGNAPGPQTWGLFSWARKNREKFYAAFHKEQVRQSALAEGDTIGARRTKFQVEEINDMLSELRSESDDPIVPAEVRP